MSRCEGAGDEATAVCISGSHGRDHRVDGDRNTICENRVDQSGIHGLVADGNENRVCRNVVMFKGWGSGIAISGHDSTIELNRA